MPEAELKKLEFPHKTKHILIHLIDGNTATPEKNHHAFVTGWQNEDDLSHRLSGISWFLLFAWRACKTDRREDRAGDSPGI